MIMLDTWRILYAIFLLMLEVNVGVNKARFNK